MKLTISKDDTVICPRIEKVMDVTHACKKCDFLGWVRDGKVVCRWSELKERILKKEVYFNDSGV